MIADAYARIAAATYIGDRLYFHPSSESGDAVVGALPAMDLVSDLVARDRGPRDRRARARGRGSEVILELADELAVGRE